MGSSKSRTTTVRNKKNLDGVTGKKRVAGEFTNATAYPPGCFAYDSKKRI